MVLNRQLLNIVALAVAICSGCQSKDTPRLIGPYRVSESGEFLFCGVRRGSHERRYVIVPLKEGHHKPHILTFPDTDRCLGATWRPTADPDELLFVQGGASRAIKRFRVSSTGIERISSNALDADLIAVLPDGCWNPSGTVLALRVTRFGQDVDSGAYLGFSKDYGKTIHVSDIRPSDPLLWIADCTFYMTHVIDADETTAFKIEVAGIEATDYESYVMTLMKAELDVDSMAVATQQVLQDNDVYLASGNLRGSLVYHKRDTLFRNGQVFAVLPEKIHPAFADGDYMAAVSANGRRLFVLDATGQIISSQETREESICIGISAATQSVYLTASYPEDRMRIYAYDFFGRSVKVVFEASRLEGTWRRTRWTRTR